MCKVSKVLSERYCYVKQYYDVKCSTETNIHICNFKANIACLPHNILFRLTKKGENIQMFQDKDIRVSLIHLKSFIFLFFVDSRQVLCVPIICRSLRSLKTFYLSRLCSTGGSLLQPNGPFPCDLELFRQITQKQIREI